jgi:hypothetical protein
MQRNTAQHTEIEGTATGVPQNTTVAGSMQAANTSQGMLDDSGKVVSANTNISKRC